MGCHGKRPDSTLMKLNDVATCGDPKMLANSMKFFHGKKKLNTRDSALEGLELFGSTKLNLPLGVNCDSYQPDKVNNSIPRPTLEPKPKGHA